MALTSGVGGANKASIQATKTALASAAKKSVTPAKPAAKPAAKPVATVANGMVINSDPNVPNVGLNLPDRAAVQKANEDLGYMSPVVTANEPAPWTLEGDPLYQAALASGKSAFSFAQAQALADKQNQETAAAQSRKSLDTNATEARRRTAGNYAARGMAGGAAGALSLAEARANAEQVAARTSIQDQISALNNQYLQNFGDASATGYDWTGTLAGQQYKTQAAQAAIQAQLARYGAA
jgi:hypothetical protein